MNTRLRRAATACGGGTKRVPAAAVLAALVLAACTSTQSDIETSGAKLPRPDLVVVQTFAASAEEVDLDGGLSAEIVDAVKADDGTSRSEQASTSRSSIGTSGTSEGSLSPRWMPNSAHVRSC